MIFVSAGASRSSAPTRSFPTVSTRLFQRALSRSSRLSSLSSRRACMARTNASPLKPAASSADTAAAWSAAAPHSAAIASAASSEPNASATSACSLVVNSEPNACLRLSIASVSGSRLPASSSSRTDRPPFASSPSAFDAVLAKARSAVPAREGSILACSRPSAENCCAIETPDSAICEPADSMACCILGPVVLNCSTAADSWPAAAQPNSASDIPACRASLKTLCSEAIRPVMSATSPLVARAVTAEASVSAETPSVDSPWMPLWMSYAARVKPSAPMPGIRSDTSRPRVAIASAAAGSSPSDCRSPRAAATPLAIRTGAARARSAERPAAPAPCSASAVWANRSRDRSDAIRRAASSSLAALARSTPAADRRILRSSSACASDSRFVARPDSRSSSRSCRSFDRCRSCADPSRELFSLERSKASASFFEGEAVARISARRAAVLLRAASKAVPDLPRPRSRRARLSSATRCLPRSFSSACASENCFWSFPAAPRTLAAGPLKRSLAPISTATFRSATGVY